MNIGPLNAKSNFSLEKLILATSTNMHSFKTKELREGVRRGRIPPALVLFFLSPTVAELLSGSAPPVEFFNPLIFSLLVSLYGSGVILVREFTRRWNKGWSSLLLLGAAYGVTEEGLMVKSFFDPTWPDLGILATYGRWAGVNWVWVEMLTIYHAVFSIAIPILVVELIYPSLRRERWVGKRALKGVFLLFIATVLVGCLVLTPYRPPVLPYLATVSVVVLLVYTARRIPTPVKEAAFVLRNFWFWLLGFLGTLAFFLILFSLPYILHWPVATMGAAFFLVFAVAWLLKRFRRKDDRYRFALVSGALSFLILLTPLQELDKTRPDNSAGMTFVGLAFLLFLFWLGWRIHRRPSERSGSMFFRAPARFN